MSSVRSNLSDDEYSEIGDKPDVGFLDPLDDDRSVLDLGPLEEGPVVISQPFPFVNGRPQSVLIGLTSFDKIDIHNTTSEPLDLWSVRIYASIPEDSYELSVMKPPSDNDDESIKNAYLGLSELEERVIQPGKTLRIYISCRPKAIGMQTCILQFNVGDDQKERRAFLLADDSISQSLSSNKPYSRKLTRGRKFDSEQVVPGYRPHKQHIQGFKYKLPQYKIPLEFQELIESGQVPAVVEQELDIKNYCQYFSTLIVMEEINLKAEMRAYDMDCVLMKRRGNNFLSLEVPGLAERRPSLVYGDYIHVQYAMEDQPADAKVYQGYIHKVEADEVFLRFDEKFHANHKNCNLYNVSFTYNRLNMRRLYKAVEDAINLGPEILFPAKSRYRRAIRRVPFTPVNPSINKEQATAVGMILGCNGGPPYVILGPPGTGKTMTIVEAILQLYTTRKKSRMLVCAASNSASDHVLAKILQANCSGVRENEVFRLNASSRSYEDVNPDFMRFCFYDDAAFKCPPLKALMQYRIIICTYMSSSMLASEGIRRGHFSHIFLDEAGQASEPETMVPMAGLCGRDTTFVLAGDPMQLGPVIYSKLAERYGFGKSFLERLFECHQYANGDENYMMKLVRNYRSHPAILELPSKLFYKNELIACKESDAPLISVWTELPNKSFPVLFVGIQGCDEREGNNPSWFNRTEVSRVVSIIKKLVQDCDVSDSDIGVIAPYRQQVLKLEVALQQQLELPQLKVGSVEQFQGQEREVIIISTVRSTVKLNSFDRIYNLGFLSNHRRFNVAITRAKSLLIIVGNPHIITKDRHWDRLLRSCADNGSYQGCPLPAAEVHSYPEDDDTGCDPAVAPPELYAAADNQDDAAESNFQNHHLEQNEVQRYDSRQNYGEECSSGFQQQHDSRRNYREEHNGVRRYGSRQSYREERSGVQRYDSRMSYRRSYCEEHNGVQRYGSRQCQNYREEEHNSIQQYDSQQNYREEEYSSDTNESSLAAPGEEQGGSAEALQEHGNGAEAERDDLPPPPQPQPPRDVFFFSDMSNIEPTGWD